jgi:hypothetical protein
MHGFEIVDAEPWSGSEEDLDATPISETFKAMDRQALLELGCHYLLCPI